MSKVSFVVRWGLVFGVLGMFTLYSVNALGVGGGNKAYADAISHNNKFKHNKNFVVFKEKGGPGRGNHGERMICAINQDQLNALRAEYSTAVYTTAEVDGESKGIVEIDKTPGTNKHGVYETIELDTNGPKCQIIKAPHSFFLYLLPGVS